MLNTNTDNRTNHLLDCLTDDREDLTWPKPTEPEPDEEQLQDWVFDSVCGATDGCAVELDGECPHGYPSWILYLGLI